MLRLASAWAGVVPAVRRPISESQEVFPESRQCRPRTICGCMLKGTNSAICSPTTSPSKPAGATPTTVNGYPFRRMSLPMIDGDSALALPIPIAQYDYGIGILGCVIEIGEQSSSTGSDAKHGEIVPAYHACRNFFARDLALA